jgi:hypothetical protein
VKFISVIRAAIGCAIASVAVLPEAAAQPTPAIGAPVVQLDYDALFQQMYRSPSNLDVSFKFAEQAVSRGDFEAAIGALERMLFFNPDLPRVKLELGVLYFKLGSYELARGYFQEALKSPAAPDEIRGQVEAYLAEIDRRLAKYEYNVFFHGGLRYQTNANIGPDGLAVRALGQDAVLDNKFGRKPDWNSFQVLAANYAYKTSTRGDALEASFFGLNSRQFTLDQFNLGVVEFLAGPRIALGQNASFKFYGIGDQVWLGDAPYFGAAGAGLSARSAIGSIGQIEGYVEARYRNFSDSLNYPTASQQTGTLLTSAVTTDFILMPQLHLATRAGYDENRAIFDYNSYRRYSLDVALPFEFPVSVFGTSHQLVIAPTVGYSWANYIAPNAIIDPLTIRRDREQRYGAILDAQLVNNVGIRTQIQYSKIDSSLPNFTTSNFSIGFGPTLRF